MRGLMVVLTLSLLGAMALGAEEIYREGFEGTVAGELPAGYTGDVGATEDEGFGGGRCLRVEGHEDNDIVSSGLIAFEPGAMLQFSARLRLAREAGAFWVQYACYDADGTMLCDAWGHDVLAHLTTSLDDWTLVQTVFTPNEAAPGASQIRLVLKWYSDPEGVAWLDDIAIRQIGEADELTNLRPIDLSAAANMGLRDETAGDGAGGWTDQGENDMRHLPSGVLEFQGVPLRIIDPAENAGRACIVLGGDAASQLPQRTEINVDERAESVLMLHNTAWSGPVGRTAATYTVTYADGEQHSFDVRIGIEASDWWSPETTERSVVAYLTHNPVAASVGLNLFEWRNPRPETEILRIEVQSPGEPAYMLVAMTVADGGPIMPALLSEPAPLLRKQDDTWRPIEMPWGVTEATATDFSFLQDAPCGIHGKLTARDGHFYWEDGTRARFFGTTVGWGSEVVEHGVAEKIALYLARSGVNLVRIHIADDCRREGAERHLEWDPEKLDRVDYLIARLKQHGIYVMFYTPMYGRYSQADGLASTIGRNAKIIGTFDERMQELTRQWWRLVLTHENRYLGHPLVEDPALAMLVLTNENELFARVPHLVEDEALAPYRQQLRERWNRWLLARYDSRDELARAWSSEEAVLQPDEDPAAGTVPLPVHRPALRVRDLAIFCDEIQREYYRDMIAFLRGLGVEVPITGTNHPYSRWGLRSLAEETDFVGMHMYWNHPARDGLTGNQSMLRDADPFGGTSSLVARTAAAKVAGKPLIIGEWNIPWPNRWRHEIMLSTAAYGCLQDWDALIWFCHFARVAQDGEPELACGVFSGGFDPPRGGLVPLAAAIFRRGDVAAARRLVEVESSDRIHDLLARAGQGSSLPLWRGLRWLPYLFRVETNFMDTRAINADADVVASDDPLRLPELAAARRRMVHLDPAAEPVESLQETYGARLRLVPSEDEEGDGRLPLLEPDEWGLPPASLPAREGGPGSAALTDDTCVRTATLYASDGDWRALARTYLQALTRWGLTAAGAQAVERRHLVSDTGEVVADHREGVFAIDAPRCRALITAQAEGGSVRLSGFTLTTDRPSTLAVISLTDRPLGETHRALITAVGDACLSGEELRANGSPLAIGARQEAPGKLRVATAGEPPMLLEPVRATIAIEGEARSVRCHALDGAGRRLEPVSVRRDGDSVSIRCDRPGSMYYELLLD